MSDDQIPKWASEDLWRKVAVWVTAGMFVILILLTFDSVAVITAGSDRVPAWSESTVARELQFLVSHTIHHHALIAAILRLESHTPAEGFGIAPSTLKYERDRAQCAQ